ncbi:CPBP family intramembrane glutamic endopeptidase [Clostridium sporogenes]|uniref:CPBP family intramembrane glutamic endopeptidase n=1 Tax=Clostridium sporogenes TaxID=1509 RepID=UPI0005EFFB16|nr:CPBP family intramembrane glutamic endopeptidase [Clostridium sporogenes]MDU6336087.1 CPBP family intramembrane glutamic endopeptidase [Clostridium sporogenes]NFQ86960.1 CPBP family intramembrane metalloprotease [Clostridium sporogenes]
MILKEIELVRQARESDRLYNIFVAYLLVFLFLIVGEIIGGIILFILIKAFKIPNNTPLSFSLSLIAGFLFSTLITFLWIKKREKRSIAGLGFCKEGFIKKYIIGFVFGSILFSIVVLLLLVTGHINLVNGLNLKSIVPLMIVLPGWIIQSATEEILVRGWLMNVLGAKYNMTIGLIFSSLLFSMLHFLNPNVSIVAVVNLFITGILFGLYVIKTQNLWGACGLHAAWNFFQGNIFGFEVSGMNIDIGSLMKLKLVGSDLFTGGSFGPEAGIACTIVLSVAIVILSYKIKNSYEKIPL